MAAFEKQSSSGRNLAFGSFQIPITKRPPVFPGDDAREFWMRAEDRISETAKIYNQLGLAEYEAMEAFVKWKF